MSSPKRYLWSQEPTKQPWRLNYHSAGGDTEPFAAQGPFAVLINDLGEPLHLLTDDNPNKLPAMDPRYSRSSLFMFALVEIFLHAITMINSPGHRLQQPNSENPRRLARIIMTIPSALSLAERRILHLRAHAARDLAYRLLRMIGGEDMPPPRTRLSGGGKRRAGEGQCRSAADPVRMGRSQRDPGRLHVYPDRPEFCRPCRRLLRRHAPGRQHHAKIPPRRHPRYRRRHHGSRGIDYRYDGAGANTTIFPEQLFREGFSIAGDDVVLHVIQEHVLGPIEDAAEAAGVPSGSATIAELFGGIAPDRAWPGRFAASNSPSRSPSPSPCACSRATRPPRKAATAPPRPSVSPTLRRGQGAQPHHPRLGQ
jgi:Uncharacterized protein conserved in bacteria, putative virulence factor